MPNTSKFYYSNLIGFYVKTMSTHGSHLGWRSWSPDTINQSANIANMSSMVLWWSTAKNVFSDPDLGPKWPPSATFGH
jgi:hypothetical protein